MKKIAGLLLSTAVLCLPTFLFAGEVVDAHEIGGDLGILERAPKERMRAAANAARSQWSGGAESFARAWSARRGGTGRESFATRTVIADELGQLHIRMSQTIAGLPVEGVELIVHADQKTGRILGINGTFAADRDVPREPAVDSRAALEFAAGAYGIAAESLERSSELTYIAGEDGALRLAWTGLARYMNEHGPQLDRIYADAISGEAIARDPQYHRAANREIYSCNNTTIRPGTLVMTETGPPSSDPVVLAAFDNLGLTFDYYKNVHNRSSYDGSNAPQVASVHYGEDFTSAFWDKNRQIIFFGDGDTNSNGEPLTWKPLAYALDITAHEFTHGVIAYSGHLNYSGEPGALNESASDCMGAAAEVYRDSIGHSEEQISAATWMVGEEAKVSGALRYMDFPGKNRTLGERYYPTRDVTGGDVYRNAGIQNLFFYLLVEGGQRNAGSTTVTVNGIGMTPAARIMYRAITGYAAPTTNYRLMREYTLQAAHDIYGLASAERASVASAWNAVGNDWSSYSGPISAGQSVVVATYSTVQGGYHTGHLSGPATANFDLYFEYRGTPADPWQILKIGSSSTAKVTLEHEPALTGEYRWRVQAVSGSGTYNLSLNWPK